LLIANTTCGLLDAMDHARFANGGTQRDLTCLVAGGSSNLMAMGQLNWRSCPRQTVAVAPIKSNAFTPPGSRLFATRERRSAVHQWNVPVDHLGCQPGA
jgi:hypothetical protein